MELCPLPDSTTINPTPVGDQRSAYVRRIDALFAVEAQSHVSETVVADLGYEANLRSETRASHRLILEPLPPKSTRYPAPSRVSPAPGIRAVSGQSGRVTADDRDPRIVQ